MIAPDTASGPAFGKYKVEQGLSAPQGLLIIVLSSRATTSRAARTATYFFSFVQLIQDILHLVVMRPFLPIRQKNLFIPACVQCAIPKLVCLSVCPPVRLFVCLFVCLSVCLSVCLPVCRCMCNICRFYWLRRLHETGSTNPGAMGASGYELTRWTCFVACRGDGVAAPGCCGFCGLVWVRQNSVLSISLHFRIYRARTVSVGTVKGK